MSVPPSKLIFLMLKSSCNISNPLPEEIIILDLNGIYVSQVNWKPEFFPKCLFPGHKCPQQATIPKDEDQQELPGKRRRRARKLTYEWNYKRPIEVTAYQPQQPAALAKILF